MHPSLRRVFADATGPLGLAPLATIPNLVELSLRDNGIDDIDLAGLAGAAKLERLDILKNTVSDIGPLAGMPGLVYFQANYNFIDSVAPLADAKKLVELRLDDNDVVDLKPLAGATSLAILEVGGNPLASLEGLEELPLVTLLAASTGISALVPVGKGTLRTLYADGDNHITSLAPLAGHEVLETVALSNNAIMSVAPIQQAPWVQAGCAELWLDGNPLDAASTDVMVPAMCASNTIVYLDGDFFCDADWTACN